MKLRIILRTAITVFVAGLARGEYVLYDDFTYPSNTFDRAKWWRGGLAGVGGSNAVFNESDLTTSMMFEAGDFKFVIGGPSASSQGLFGLGDIDDGDPFLVLKDSGAGWRFHVRNGDKVYTGPVVAFGLAKGDVVVFHWDSAGSHVSINGVLKDSQAAVRPPRMPMTLLEWNDSGTNGQLVVDSVSYSATQVSCPKPAETAFATSARTKVLAAECVADTFVDCSQGGTNCHARAPTVGIRNGRFHPDLTGAGAIENVGQFTLVQFALPPLPAGWQVAGARLAGVVAQNHRLYGMPGWAPARPIELELLGLDTNPDLATATYQDVRDAAGRGVVTDFAPSGSENFAFGAQAQSLEVLRFSTADTPVGSRVQFPDRQGRLCALVRRRISQAEPKAITLAIGPGRTQAVSGMECDFSFFARENTAGRAALALELVLEEGR